MLAVRKFVAGTITPVAPVAAVPTTAAHFALWNGELKGGKTYTITSIGFTSIVSAGAAIVMQQLAHVSAAVVPVIAGTAAAGPRSVDGTPGGSNAVVYSAVTVVAGNGIWHPVGMSVNGGAATATIAMGVWTPVKGLYTLPPGGLLSLAVLCSAAGTATCNCYVTWEEA